MPNKNTYEVLAQKVDGQLHAAMIRNGDIVDFYVDNNPESPRWASIYLGKVVKIDTGLNGAFVSLSGNQQGFISAKHALKSGVVDKDAPIQDKLRPGQMVLVQVKSEGKMKTPFENEKLPRLSMKIYLPGRLLYFNPYGRGGIRGVAEFQDDAIKAFLVKLEKYGSWYIHGNENTIELDALKHEAKRLIEIWRGMKEALQHSSENPRLLYMGPNALQRMIIDYNTKKFNHFEIAEDVNPNSMSDWLAGHAPYLQGKMIISPAHKIDVFESRDIYSTLELAHDKYVPLPGGGSIIIDGTHAMTVIDVNRGSGGSIADVNKEAAKYVARHFRLRNLSGAILIDFISLPSKSERYELMRLLKQVIGNDPGQTAVHGFTRLGIMEVTRKRRTSPLFEKSNN